MFYPYERYRSVTPLGVTRVNRTILQFVVKLSIIHKDTVAVAKTSDG